MLNNLGKRRSFEYNEIDVMAPEQQEWKNAYEFDVPVVGICHEPCNDGVADTWLQVHIQRVFHTYSKPDIATEARKLMHHINEEEVEKLIDEAEGHS